jgi:hypothetical protein
MEEEKTNGGMGKYCLQCPKFTLFFHWSECGIESLLGTFCSVRVRGACRTKCGYDISDSSANIKTVAEKEDIMHGWNSICENGKIPKELEPQIQKYASQNDCPKRYFDKNCMFYMERKIEEWNAE